MKTRLIALAMSVIVMAWFSASAQTWEQTTAPAFDYPCITSSADGSGASTA